MDTDSTAYIEREIQAILKQADDLNVRNFEELPAVQLLRDYASLSCRHYPVSLRSCKLFAAFIAVLLLSLTLVLIFFSTDARKLATAYCAGVDVSDLESQECLLDLQPVLVTVARPPVDCSLCSNLTNVDRVSEISPDAFEMIYAYSGRPVVVTDAMANWTAHRVFSFDFFRELYVEKQVTPAAGDVDQSVCQFFPYRSNFQNLSEVFQMSTERAMMKMGSEPWYIGWSNCDSTAANQLRQHYTRPYFLPKAAESSRTDWIFMGSPGYGAHMHIDNVKNPSWQAQVSGTKLWTIEPPTECYFDCPHSLQVTVHRGEIIVLDTNKWYHETKIIGNEMSITIGSEYD